jgi:hypothetical protein
MRIGQKFGSIKFIVASLYFFAFVTFGLYSFPSNSPSKSQQETQVQKLLKEIHDEVVEIGVQMEDNFIKREFWMELDGNEGNKEEHVVVMRHDDGHDLKMTVQVTYYMPDKGLHWVRFAHTTKSVLCCIRENGFDIYRSDYSSEEMTKLFPEILKGIRNKKEILKLIKKEN